jgi:hypothetical protein
MVAWKKVGTRDPFIGRMKALKVGLSSQIQNRPEPFRCLNCGEALVTTGLLLKNADGRTDLIFRWFTCCKWTRNQDHYVRTCNV